MFIKHDNSVHKSVQDDYDCNISDNVTKSDPVLYGTNDGTDHYRNDRTARTKKRARRSRRQRHARRSSPAFPLQVLEHDDVDPDPQNEYARRCPPALSDKHLITTNSTQRTIPSFTPSPALPDKHLITSPALPDKHLITTNSTQRTIPSFTSCLTSTARATTFFITHYDSKVEYDSRAFAEGFGWPGVRRRSEQLFLADALNQNYEDRIATVLEKVEHHIPSERALMMWLSFMDDFAKGLGIKITVDLQGIWSES
jgi:hypothetical protein